MEPVENISEQNGHNDQQRQQAHQAEKSHTPAEVPGSSNVGREGFEIEIRKRMVFGGHRHRIHGCRQEHQENGQ